MFKYTVAGALVGSWTIGSANSQPTAITIDPSIVSNIWIVDSFADSVFQYTAAASRSSGSQSAATSFALAAGNTNPQGIADPPVRTVSTGNRRVAPGHPSRANGPLSVRAVDDYLTSEIDQHAGRRSGSLADSFLDTLFGPNQRRAKVRGIKHSAR